MPSPFSTIRQLECRPLLVVISGPSGVGKDAVLNRMKELGRPYHFTVTVTTRRRRLSEVDGKDYTFVNEKAFENMVQAGELLEHAKVYGHWYGVPKSQVKKALEQEKDVLIKADVQGAATIKSLVPQGVYIFLAPPSFDELERRLRQRETETPEAMTARLKTAACEMEHLFLFDYVVVNYNDELDQTVGKIEAIIQAERCRLPVRHVVL